MRVWISVRHRSTSILNGNMLFPKSKIKKIKITFMQGLQIQTSRAECVILTCGCLSLHFLQNLRGKHKLSNQYRISNAVRAVCDNILPILNTCS